MFQYVGKVMRLLSCRRQRKQVLPNVACWGLSTDVKGALMVGGLSCVQLAQGHGTPLLVVDAAALRHRAQEVKAVVSSLSEKGMVTYSYKTNCIPGILRILHNEGVGAEVISEYEYWLAENLGVAGKDIVYNGVDKSHWSISRAIGQESLINVDNRDEVGGILAEAKEQGRRARVGLRLAFDATSQFGVFPESEDAQVILQQLLAESEHADLCGLHLNVTSNARSSGYHIRCLKKALNFVQLLKEKHGVVVRYLDIGGGFGVDTSKNMTGKEYGLYRLFGMQPRRAYLEPFQGFREYMGDVASVLKAFCSATRIPEPTLIIEPGRLLTSKAELLLATVKTVKDRPGGGAMAITDAGRLSNAFPCDFEYHEAFLANDVRRPLLRPYTVTGRVCTKSDWLFKGRLFPRLASGDVLAVMDAGAYFSSYAMNFAFPRAEIISVENGQVEVLRTRETFRHLVAMDRVTLIREQD